MFEVTHVQLERPILGVCRWTGAWDSETAGGGQLGRCPNTPVKSRTETDSTNVGEQDVTAGETARNSASALYWETGEVTRGRNVREGTALKPRISNCANVDTIARQDVTAGRDRHLAPMGVNRPVRNLASVANRFGMAQPNLLPARTNVHLRATAVTAGNSTGNLASPRWSIPDPGSNTSDPSDDPPWRIGSPELVRLSKCASSFSSRACCSAAPASTSCVRPSPSATSSPCNTPAYVWPAF